MTKQKDNSILVFSIGTRRLAGVLANVEGGVGRILRFLEIRNAEGFQKGGVVDLEKASRSVGEILKKLELGEEALEIPTYLLLSGPHLKMSRFSSSIYYPGYPKVVTPHEVARVIEQTKNVAPLPLEDWILQVVPESFWVNDLTGVQDPLGLEAQRLAVQLQIFTTPYASFRNLSRVFETLDLNVKGYFPKTLVLPEGILTEEEKEGEVLVIDFSDDVTHLILTRGGKTVQTKSLDVGSRYLTSRVQETWQLGLADAERLKERFGSLEEDLKFGEELIPLFERDGLKNHQIRRAEFHQSFFRFGEELFAKVEQEVKGLLASERLALPAFVLTGGGVKLEGLLEFAGRRFSAPVRLGTPRQLDAAPELLMDPAWSGTAGLLRWLSSEENDKGGVSVKENFLAQTFGQVKDWFAAYF